MTETTNNKDITQLLQSVTAIKSKYDEINRITGADYNIFNVLKLQSDEVRLHSRFIGDLLNPKGKHGQGDLFLKLFVDQVKYVLSIDQERVESNGKNKKIVLDIESNSKYEKSKNILNKLDTSNAKVRIEEYIGEVKTDEGGRIDLAIKESTNVIVIENKINAKDQEQQLIRYYNRYPTAVMIYLTLDGKKATEISITSNKKDVNGERKVLISDVDYIRMSYKENILSWLQGCKPITNKFSHLKESLSQYINIIEQLTGQTMSNKIKDEVKKLLINSSNELLESVKILEDSITSIINETKGKIFNNFGQIDTINIDEEYKITRSKLDDDSEGVYFTYDLYRNNKMIDESSNNEIFIKCREYLILCKADIEINSYHLGWYTPKVFKDIENDSINKSFIQLRKDKIISLYFDEEKYKLFIDNILAEEKDILDCFRNYLSK